MQKISYKNQYTTETYNFRSYITPALIYIIVEEASPEGYI